MVTAVRRFPWVAVALSVIVVYAFALLVVGSRFMTTDAAKYVGIGRNMLAGRGPVTVFDAFFPHHSPTWPVIVMAPEALAGLEWTVWSRALQVAAAVLVLAITGFLASRAGLRAGVLAVALFAAFPYGFELARDVGLDEVAAASTLGFVVVALHAGTRRATRWGVLAGLAFGIAFLIKEIVLPFAPLPVLAVLVAGRGWRVALRLLGTFAVVAFATAAWWFALFASETGRVYRLGTPAWTLVPIALLIGSLAVVGLSVGRDGPAGDRLVDPPGRGATAYRERVLAWLTAAGWSVLLATFFQISRDDVGNSLITPGQYAHYLGTWGGQLLPLVGLAGVGALGAIWQRARGQLSVALSTHVDTLLLALIIGTPLIMVVVAVGDPPRHYIAQLSILTALGAMGWIVALGRLRVGRDGRGGALRDGRRWVVPLAVSAAVALSGVSLARSVARDVRTVPLADRSRAAAIDEVGDWLATVVAPGDTLALGATLNYEIATRLPVTARARVVREDQQVVARLGFPLGVGRPSGRPADDWVVLITDSHDTDSFYGYRSSVTLDRLRDDSVDVWVEGGIAPAGVELPIAAALSHATGITPRKSWVWPYPQGQELRLTGYSVDTASLGWRGSALYLDAGTLQRLIGLFEAHPVEQSQAARAVLDRVVLVDGPRPDLLDRLRVLAGG